MRSEGNDLIFFPPEGACDFRGEIRTQHIQGAKPWHGFLSPPSSLWKKNCFSTKDSTGLWAAHPKRRPSRRLQLHTFHPTRVKAVYISPVDGNPSSTIRSLLSPILLENPALLHLIISHLI